MKIEIKEIRHVADLARLDLSEERLEVFTRQLNNLLEYMDKLNELDTTHIKPTTHVVRVENAFREDKVLPSLPIRKALANAPREEHGSFVVPRVI